MKDRRTVPRGVGVLRIAAGAAAVASLTLGGCSEEGVGPAETTGGVGFVSGGSAAATGQTTGWPGQTGSSPGQTTGDVAQTTGTPATDGGAPAVNAPKPSCDVAPIFESKCQLCHGEELVGGAPMPLVTHADFQGTGPITSSQTILDLIGARIRDPQNPMPPAGDLTEEEKVAIETWIQNGAPSDEGAGCGGEGDAAEDSSDTGTEKQWPPPDATACYEIRSHAPGDPGSPMLVEAGAETHPDVIHDAPWGNEPMEAVGFRSITDNAKVLHHWILYEETDSAFGGAFITGWAPGKDETDLADDVAMFLPSGPQSLRLNMHYYNVGGDQQELDESGVEVCVAPVGTRKNTATVFMDFSNILGLRLPPQQETDIVDYCRIVSDGPVTALSVSPHMHEYGIHSKLEVKRADTGEIEVWNDAGFAFDDQKVISLGDAGKTLYPGDEVKTTCRYRNTSNQVVTFGENTDDEMCFNFVAYYPKDSFSCEDPSGGLFGGLLGGGWEAW